jgi:hypothetical protein
MKTRWALNLQLWDRSSPLYSPLIPFSDQHWTQNTHHGVGAELDFPFCFFKRWFMEHENYGVCEWSWGRGTVGMCDHFLTRVLCVCRCPLW